MNTQLITRTLPVGYSYNVIQHLDLKKCPHCQAENPMVMPDGRVVCADCGQHIGFNSTAKSRLQYANALYYSAGMLDHEEMFEEALPLYKQAEEIFLQALKKKADANLIYCLAQIHYARARAILPEDTDKALQEFDAFLQLMEQFAKERAQDGAACFIVARTYYNTAQQLNGISPVIGYLQSSLDWLEKAQGKEKGYFEDFIFNMKQDTMLALANALNNPEEKGYDRQKARDLYLELSEILETCRLEPEHVSLYYPKESYAPSVFVKIAEGAGQYAKALKESGQAERIPYMFQRAMDFSRKVMRYFESPSALEAMMQVYRDAYDYYRAEKEYEAAREIMEKRADLWKSSLFRDLDFYTRHHLLDVRMETNRLLADLFHESGQKEQEEKAYKASINFLSRAKKSYQDNYPWFEAERAFKQMQARYDLGSFYLKENNFIQAAKTFQTMLNEYEAFLESHADHPYVKQRSLFPERQLAGLLIDLLENLDEADQKRKPIERLLKQAQTIQDSFEEKEDDFPIFDPADLDEWD